DRVGDDRGDLPLALAGEAPVLLSRGPILDVEMGRVGLTNLPALHRVVAAEDKVGRVERRLQGLAPHRVEQVGQPLRRVAVDAVLVLVKELNSLALRELDLLPHPAHDLVAVRGPVAVELFWGVVAENADVRRAEDLAQVDRPPELFEVRAEWLVDP